MPRSQEGLKRLVARQGVSDRVVAAFGVVDRAEFVPPGARGSAYLDRPVGLPEGQTTSQPSLIARMIDAADVRAGNRVLEVGTGYGFQTALLVELEADVTSIERFPALARDAAANLRRTGKAKAHLEVGDGWGGVAERAPFDAIIVSAEASRVPPRLAEQLAEGGRLVIPLRSEAHGAAVFLLGKTDGALAERRLLTPARFVPLVPFSDSGA